MATVMVSTYERPDLVPVVARWLWEAFWRHDGYTLADTLAAVRESVTADPIPRSFVILVDGEPVGTASLAAQDLDDRPDLTPWLAGVFVLPQARRQGFATQLVVAAEQVARAAGVETLWLYTKSAERLYARMGWRTVERIRHRGGAYALMQRTLLDQ